MKVFFILAIKNNTISEIEYFIKLFVKQFQYKLNESIPIEIYYLKKYKIYYFLLS